MPKPFLVLMLACACVVNSRALAQTPADKFFENFSADELASGLLSLVQFTTIPGIRGIDFTVDDAFTNTDMEYGKTNVTVVKNFGEFELGKSEFSLYTELGFGILNLKQSLPLTVGQDQSVLFDAERDLHSGWLGLGLNFKLPHYLRLQPYVALAYSQFETQTTVTGEDFDTDDLPPLQQQVVLDTKAKAWTVTPTLKLKYDRWLQAGRVELEGIYSYSYSNTFDTSSPLLDAAGGTDLLSANAKWTAPTGLSFFDSSLYWNVFGVYTDFISLSRRTLGFNDYFEFGAGLEFKINQKILGFKLEFVGLEFSSLVGEDLNGWTWAITVRD